MEQRWLLEEEDKRRNRTSISPRSATRRSPRIREKEKVSTIPDVIDNGEPRGGSSPSPKTRRLMTTSPNSNSPRGRTTSNPDVEVYHHFSPTKRRPKRNILEMRPVDDKVPETRPDDDEMRSDDYEVSVPIRSFPSLVEYPLPIKTSGDQSLRTSDASSQPLKPKPVPKPTIQQLPEETNSENLAVPVNLCEDSEIARELPQTNEQLQVPASLMVQDDKAEITVVSPEKNIISQLPVAPSSEINTIAPEIESIPNPSFGVARPEHEGQQQELFNANIFDKRVQIENQKENQKLQRKEQTKQKEYSPPGEEAKKEVQVQELTEEEVLEEGTADTGVVLRLQRNEEEENVIDGQGSLPGGDDEIQIVDTNGNIARADAERADGGKEVMAEQEQKNLTQQRHSLESVEEREAPTPSKEGSAISTDEEDNSHEQVAFNESHVKGIFANFLSLLGIVMLPFNGITDARLNDDVIPKIDNLKLVQEVRLNRNILTKLPESFKQTSERTRSLTLTCNKINRLPDWFCEISAMALKQLFLSSNALEVLPSDIHKLTYLEVLDVNSNFLTKIPPGVGHLRMLKVLNLSNNLLICLPDNIGVENENLLSLDLSDNEDFFAPLPSCLEACACTIEDLFIDKTKLKGVLSKKEKSMPSRELVLFLSTLSEEDLIKRIADKAILDEKKKKRLSKRLSAQSLIVR